MSKAKSFRIGCISILCSPSVPPEARGIFLGMWRLTGQGGATASPILFALFAEALGYGASFVFVSASAVVVAWLLIFYVPETRTRG